MRARQRRTLVMSLVCTISSCSSITKTKYARGFFTVMLDYGVAGTGLLTNVHWCAQQMHPEILQMQRQMASDGLSRKPPAFFLLVCSALRTTLLCCKCFRLLLVHGRIPILLDIVNDDDGLCFPL